MTLLAQQDKLVGPVPVIQHGMKGSHLRIINNNIIFRMLANIGQALTRIEIVKLNMAGGGNDFQLILSCHDYSQE
jgi:hypothetical protein